eukprot:12243194-Alexandrium_andersonii.AAC.1
MITYNKFLVGAGPDKRFHLKPDTAIMAFERLFEKLDSGFSPHALEFINDYCFPFKFQEQWIASTEAKFGATATRFPAWA